MAIYMQSSNRVQKRSLHTYSRVLCSRHKTHNRASLQAASVIAIPPLPPGQGSGRNTLTGGDASSCNSPTNGCALWTGDCNDQASNTRASKAVGCSSTLQFWWGYIIVLYNHPTLRRNYPTKVPGVPAMLWEAISYYMYSTDRSQRKLCWYVCRVDT